MKTNRRSQKNRADKYSRRSAALLDQFHFERAESHFLAIMESGLITVEQLRELTWAQVRFSYEGLVILETVVPLRNEYLESFRDCLSEGKGFYDEELNGSDGSPRMFSRESIKNISKELDQFKI